MTGQPQPAVPEPGLVPEPAAPQPAAPEPGLVLDCRGRPCPVPVIELARALPTVAVGAVVQVLSDDPAARLDFPAWCRMRGQDYLGESPAQTFSIRRVA